MDIQPYNYTLGHKLVARTIAYDPAKRAPVALSTTGMYAMDLVFVSGTALVQYKGTGPSWRRDRVLIDTSTLWTIETTGPYAAISQPQVAATASLASISNSGQAVDAGWAVDEVQPEWQPVAGTTKRLVLVVSVAVRDSDGYILRIAFDAKVVGILKQL